VGVPELARAHLNLVNPGPPLQLSPWCTLVLLMRGVFPSDSLGAQEPWSMHDVPPKGGKNVSPEGVALKPHSPTPSGRWG